MTAAHAEEDMAILLAVGLRPWESELLTLAETTALIDQINRRQ